MRSSDWSSDVCSSDLAMPLYNGEELRTMIEQATYVTVNDYESSLLQERTGLSTRDIAERVEAYIITRGPSGSAIHTKKGELLIPAANAPRVVDPTGSSEERRVGKGWCGRVRSG